MLDQFVIRKNTLIRALEQAVAYSRQKGNTLAASLLIESRERLIQETFTLVILGEFKRGKSTFINALLGTQLLPTAIVPLTAIPTVIRYGENLGVCAVHMNGVIEEISLEQMPDYVTEKGNPKNTKGVREVKISYPSEFLKQGIILVDTPGVGSVYQHNTEAAYAYLPNSDAAAFIISIDAPLSKIELEYLKEISKYVNKLFYVLNKVDIATEEDVIEAGAFTVETLKSHLGGENYELFLLSARQALQSRTDESKAISLETSGMLAFEKKLGNFILSNKGNLILEASAARALRTIGELEIELQLWQKAMEGSIQELDQKIDIFTAQMQSLQQELEDSIYLLYREVDRLGGMVGDNIYEFLALKTDELVKLLEEYYHKVSPGKSSKELAILLNQYSRELILSVLDEKRNEQRLVIREQFESVALRFFGRIENIVDRMMEVSAEIFNVTVDKSASKEYILGTKRFYFYFEDNVSFIPKLETLTSLGIFPKVLVGGRLLKNAKSKLAELFDRNCGRVRVDLVEGLKESARDVAGELRLRADSVSKGLLSALQKARSERGLSEKERAERVKTWHKEFGELRYIKDMVQQVIVSD